MKGVRKITNAESTIFFVDCLTDELKDKIRSDLVSICHGAANADSPLLAYSYSATVKEFVKRYKENATGNNNRNKGMIGELLFHVLFELENEYKPISAFFNLEERSFKKGFDSAYHDVSSNEIWLAEVKSGEIQKNQTTASAAGVNLLNTAKNDLKKRLNSENNSLWLNAINHAEVAYRGNRDEKQMVIDLLGMYSDKAVQSIFQSNDKNVILTAVLFHNISEEVEVSEISKKHTRIAKENLFAKFNTIVIQKSTYDAIYTFLESEAKA